MEQILLAKEQKMQPKNKKNHPQNILNNKFKIRKNCVYSCTINIRNVDKFTAPRLLGITDSGILLVKRDINRDGEFKTIFFSKDIGDEIYFSVKMNHENSPENLNIIASSLDIKLIEEKRNSKLITDDSTVCVAIATYPGRKKSLLESIDSLIDQTDYILLYLNEYKGVPEEIASHKNRYKIVCIVDEDGSRRAEGKFHWLHRVNGYYLTCDDDIIYPKDYIVKTIKYIELFNRKCVVGYHGVIFNNSVASFKGDRKKFYKFTDVLNQAKVCHLLGTGVAGCHSSLFITINTNLLYKFSFAVDPALSVICKINNVKMICLPRSENWLISSPHMQYGLHEEKQVFTDKKKAVDDLLINNNPWGGGKISLIFAKLKKNAKFRKFINNPKKFFQDSKYFGSIKNKGRRA